MPCNNLDEFLDILSKIVSIINIYNDCHMVIESDFNSALRSPSFRNK